MSGRSDMRSAWHLCWAIALPVCYGGCAAGAPCDGIDRVITPSEKAAFAAAVAPQIGAVRIDVLDSFHLGTWRILYVDSHVTDEAFLFFAADPRSSHYIMLWSGGAAPNEEVNIRRWVGGHAPGMPRALAGCFAWRVTNDQNR